MLEKHSEVLERCTICHDQCAFSCPVFAEDRRTTVYPSRKAQVARAVVRGELPFDEETARLFYQCTSCRLCWRWCVYLRDRKDLVPALRAARTEAVARGVVLAEVASLAERTRKEGTPWGNLAARHAELAKEAPRAGREEVLLFADAASLALNPEAFAAFFTLARAAGLTVRLSESLLTGFELADIGLVNMAKAERTRSQAELTAWFRLPEAGPVVTLNPQVAYAFNHWYREEGVALPGEVQTQSAFFARLVETGRLRFKVSSRAAVLQDSAYQARYLEDSKTPRLALGAAFSDLREAVPSGAEANPAAPEGLAPELSPQVKGRMPNRRLRELLETGARQIVTLDPYSYHALVQAAGDGVSCLDLTQALAALVEHP
jgi:Fe-S oxidoreductase